MEVDKNNYMEINNNPIVIKGEIFSDYLNYNSIQNSLINAEHEDNNETFDVFFNRDENSYKSLNSEKNAADIQLSNVFNIKSFRDKINSEFNKENKKKKKVFNTLKNKENLDEEIKKKKLLMNRLSAKKSRLKKKNYIENLEKQYLLLKEEFFKIRENQKKNSVNLFSIYNQQYLNYNINNNINNNNNNANNIYEKIYNEKNSAPEKNIKLSDSAENNNNLYNQKKLMIYLLIHQIDLMTPIKVKKFQEKFFKMQVLDFDDSLEIIKNKINTNLDMITELYGIGNEAINNGANINCNYNKDSLIYQFLDFYKNIKILINKYENIFKNIDDL